jgi:hypothetical protein
MVHTQPENHPNGYNSRQLAFADARMVIASLCARERSTAYKAAVMEALRAIDAAAPPDPEVAAQTAISDDDTLWELATAEVGTVKVPPYSYPVIVLARPMDLGAMVRAVAKKAVAGAEGPSGLEASDRERLLYAGRVLRAIADQGRDVPLGSLWSEAVIGARAIRHVLGVSEANSAAMGLKPCAANPLVALTALGELMAGWQEAAMAWRTCAGIHRAYARAKDPTFAKNQQDFSQRAAAANAKCTVITGPALADIAV